MLPFGRAITLFLILLFVTEITSGQDRGRLLRIGTGSTTGNYYRIGWKIKEISERNLPNITIEVISTSGSVSNLQMIQDGSLEIAIAQNDIAYMSETGGIPGVFDLPFSDVTAIMTLYPEPIYLLTSNVQATRLGDLAGSTISIGRVGSGTAVNARTIFADAGLLEKVSIRNDDKSILDSLFTRGVIQAAVLNSFPESVLEMVQLGRIQVMSMPRQLQDQLVIEHPYFTKYERVFEGEIVRTLAVKSMLVAHSSIEPELISGITRELYLDWAYLSSHFPRHLDQYAREELTESVGISRWHSGAESVYYEMGAFRKTVPLSFLVAVFLPISLLLILGAINMALFSFSRAGLKVIPINTAGLRWLRNVNLFVLDNKYVLLIVLVVGSYFANLLAIEYFEERWANSAGTINIFHQHNFLDNLLWLFVFSVSGYDEGRFPGSPIGQVVASLVPLVGLSGLLALVGLVTSDHLKTKMLASRGFLPANIKNHIILCGWNKDVPFLAQNLVHPNITNRRPVVILADIEEETPLLKFNLEDELITFVRGTATNKDDLEKAKIQFAEMAIIVSDDDALDPDARNILKILTIEKHCKKLEDDNARHGKENIYTIAEIKDPKNFQIASDAYVDEIVSLGHIKSKIFVQSALNPGVSTFLNEVLTYNRFNEIYSVAVSSENSLIGHTFDEILLELRKHKVLLLSINVQPKLDKARAAEVLERHSLNEERRVLTNPVDGHESNYRVQAGDTLIVLAQFEGVIDNMLRAFEGRG